MSRSVTYAPAAVKALRKIDPAKAKRIVAKVQDYADDPAALANNVTPLKGSGFKRLRVGDYRVIFTEDLRVVSVATVGHRSHVYD